MPSDVGSEAKECAMIIAEYHGRLELPWTAELPALVYYFYNFGDRRSGSEMSSVQPTDKTTGVNLAHASENSS
jgi:hypothetical protein